MSRNVVLASVLIAACPAPAPSPSASTPSTAAPNTLAIAPEPASDASAPSATLQVDDFTLGNGIRVLAVRQPATVVNLNFVFLGAPARIGEASALRSLMIYSLRLGTATRSSQEVAAAIDAAFATCSTRVTHAALTLAFRVVGERLESAIELAKDMVQSPTFPAGPVEEVRTKVVTSLERERQQLAPSAEDAWQAAMFGTGSAYAINPYGTPAGARATTRDSIAATYSRIAGPRALAITVGGDYERVQLQRLLEEHFGHWRPANEATPSQPAPPPASLPPRTLILADVPGRGKAAIVAGLRAVPFLSPEWAAASVFDEFLTTRVRGALVNVRHLADKVDVVMTGNGAVGTLSYRMTVAEEKVAPALEQLEHEMRSVRDEGFADEEVADARARARRRFNEELREPSRVPAMLAGLALAGAPADRVSGFDAELASVDAEAIRRVASRVLDLDHLVVSVAGTRAQLEPALARAGWSPRKAWLPN